MYEYVLCKWSLTVDMEAEKKKGKDTLVSTDTELFSGLKEPYYPDYLYVYHLVRWIVLQRCIELPCRSSMAPQLKYGPEITKFLRVQSHRAGKMPYRYLCFLSYLANAFRLYFLEY